MRVLVTGASGFVGGRVVEAMACSGFADPIAGIRQWSRAARIARAPVQIALCDIMDPSQVRDVVGGVEAIIHCAYSDDRDSIVTGTRNLLEAAAAQGIERFVMLSTAEVYGADVAGDVIEESPAQQTGGVYGDSKIEAEQVCREFSARGVAATILRPSLVYGPFSRSWTVNVAKRLQSGRWGQFDEYGEGIANLVYVDDLVQAIFRSLHAVEARGETFNVNGPEQPTWNEYFSRFNKTIGLPPLANVSASQTQLRSRVMDFVGRTSDAVRSRFDDQLMRIYLRDGLAGRLMKRLKAAMESTPSGDELKGLFSRKAIYRDAKARDLLGYSPQFGLSTGLSLSVAWLRHHGQIDEAVLLDTPDEPCVPTSANGEVGQPVTVRGDVDVTTMEDALA